LNLTHAQQLLVCQENAEDVEKILLSYNEVIDKVNSQMEFLGEQMLI
jgi:hypothetical protein